MLQVLIINLLLLVLIFILLMNMSFNCLFWKNDELSFGSPCKGNEKNGGERQELKENSRTQAIKKSDVKEIERITNQKSSTIVQEMEHDDKHDVEMKKKKTFRRYGLLANRSKIATLTSSSSDSESSSSSSDSELSEVLVTRSKAVPRIESESDSRENVEIQVPASPRIQSSSLADELDTSKILRNTEVNQATNKRARTSEESISSVPLTYPLSLKPSPEKCLDRCSLSHTDIQFRPNNPSIYGCQRNISTLMCSSSNLFDTIDKPSTSVSYDCDKETFLSESSSDECPVEILRPELKGYELSPHLLVAPKTGIGRVNLPLHRCSRLSDTSSDDEIMILDDEPPPCLMRNSPPRKHARAQSPRNSPPSLQPVIPPIPSPPMLYSPRVAGQSGAVNTTAFADARKRKMERFHLRHRAKKEAEAFKKALLKKKFLFFKKKSEEASLLVKNLQLKIKLKESRLNNIEKNSD